ncbi:MAG: hypothetical protein A3K06_03605 [Candidatus Doudnabacteria bacterium RIFCSPHIGHO2_01_52_17]|uniref:Nudix hydrolase domain-containing protein n=1 Tax=Candidatus Doudnabacteria bacterium RIFCSPHIGHO2_01_52_17 TaxID=1817820 RepID=A0A1F5NG48_9BACT|nr:MAG: NUDIX hydrolase [Parcubacteria group bacterium GW2011_GWA2_52_8]OGE76492.1 MAG: hypothetical protein A3K06_03605 [Candidatus Doudnabacteria bacterium RIFCSPHIGHO2_01_52_17]
MKLPKKARRVFKGILYDVYHWRQQMYDGSFETFEGLKRANTVNVLPVVGDKVLIGYQSQPGMKPFIGLFGGRIDRGEAPLAAAKRELLEETGYESGDWVLLDTAELSTKVEWKSYFYAARDSRPVAPPTLERGEKIRIQRINFEKFMEWVASEKFRDKEVALTVLRLLRNPRELRAFKRLIFKR